MIRRRGWRRTLEDVGLATLAEGDWFNTQQLLESIGFVPPVAFEVAY